MLRIRESFTSPGAKLYLCSTPIGNLQDVSFRLLATLREADVVAAEDTRQTRKLLTHYEIHPKHLVSYHEHNARARGDEFVRWWDEGKSIAVVSDAGTPGISDPGEHAVALAIERGVPVVPIPGPSAVLAAVISSGFPAHPFTFVGFLPREKKARAEQLKSLSHIPWVLVFYEAPHRLIQTMEAIGSQWPSREVALAKELTKRHETFVMGRPDEVLEYLKEYPPRGEYVLVVGPCPPAEEGADGLTEEMSDAQKLEQAISLVHTSMGQGQPHAQAVRLAAEQTGARRKDVYQATLPK
ncbi:16S rRNA (cytidine(1402)-2'-O)-methyltransferase [Alicyclobacillus tolerans]|uniref:16S rRNA (cytidine(1402)-2'-O)-methyltransferase n=1 Tax=Alicyclobacillus tolerans TaxID=90970 RepID=UPI001F031CB1|nr:16S rRNA (cytidine(1402)-2'-O)-methyltransferase [Alicyclobacillus tolerans]MCF8566282.1 16S rRNA (cytidine(1402)-2'-O)-methyltransferase [Alicyclobacillus tolerans]